MPYVPRPRQRPPQPTGSPRGTPQRQTHHHHHPHNGQPQPTGPPTGTGQPPSHHPPTQPGPPVDPGLMAQQAQAGLALGLGGAWDTYQQGQIGLQYGNLNNPAADAVTNPYSQAALAYKRYNEAQAGTTNSYAAGGQLYAGALQRASETNAGNYSQTLAGLRQGKQGQLDQITENSLNRFSQYGAQANTSQLQSIMDIVNAALGRIGK